MGRDAAGGGAGGRRCYGPRHALRSRVPCWRLTAAAAGLRRERRQVRQGVPQLLHAGVLGDADKEIAAAPAGERDKLREQKMEALEGRMGTGLQMCQSQCVRGGRRRPGQLHDQREDRGAVEVCVRRARTRRVAGGGPAACGQAGGDRGRSCRCRGGPTSPTSADELTSCELDDERESRWSRQLDDELELDDEREPDDDLEPDEPELDDEPESDELRWSRDGGSYGGRRSRWSRAGRSTGGRRSRWSTTAGRDRRPGSSEMSTVSPDASSSVQ